MFCFDLGEDLKKELKREAKSKGLSLSAYIRIILRARKK